MNKVPLVYNKQVINKRVNRMAQKEGRAVLRVSGGGIVQLLDIGTKKRSGAGPRKKGTASLLSPKQNRISKFTRGKIGCQPLLDSLAGWIRSKRGDQPAQEAGQVIGVAAQNLGHLWQVVTFLDQALDHRPVIGTKGPPVDRVVVSTGDVIDRLDKSRPGVKGDAYPM
jgi:hypothetical protein